MVIMEKALELDGEYPESLRDEFNIPTFKSMGLSSDDKPVTYLCGNSLGLMPKSTRNSINAELDAWSDCAVESHFKHPEEARGKVPWVSIDLPILPLLAPIVGAQENEVAVMNSLTANLNSLLITFYKPTEKRFKILFEKGSFPSDYYAFYNQCKIHGISEPENVFIQIEPREGETYIRTQDILDTIEVNQDELALVCLSGVQYYTGQYFDIGRITSFAHQFPDILVGWDLAHAVGNVPLQLHDWGVDFACWCSYKYLNAGPGGIGGLFVHSKHTKPDPAKESLPRLAGWWGNDPAKRFQMLEVFEPIPGALGFRQSNPSVIDTVALRSSLELFAKFNGINEVRKRSLLLTNYMTELLEASKYYKHPLRIEKLPCFFTILTPTSTDEEHGAQLSLYFDSDTGKEDIMPKVFQYLHDHGVIGDARRPNVIRLAPAPLYNTFSDVYIAVNALNEAMDKL
ncbi:kynureninase [Streptococcus uberis]